MRNLWDDILSISRTRLGRLRVYHKREDDKVNLTVAIRWPVRNLYQLGGQKLPREQFMEFARWIPAPFDKTLSVSIDFLKALKIFKVDFKV